MMKHSCVFKICVALTLITSVFGCSTDQKAEVATPVTSVAVQARPTSMPSLSPEFDEVTALYTRRELPRTPADEESAPADEVTDTPVAVEEIPGDVSLTATRPWQAPDFSKQEAAIGWSETAFSVPKGLEPNFQFWLDIYSKYTTDQGVLHDTENIDLIYEVLDFTSITSKSNINIFRKDHLRQKMVNDAKKRVEKLLAKLSKIKNPENLNAEERRIWDRFGKIEGKHKFKEATSKSRLRFQLGQRDRIVQGIFFSGRYLEDFEKIFREAGVPAELTRLPFVESSYNVLAGSKVGASGLWQIMPYTGRPYLTMNDAIDKRNHPIEATKLAAKLLRNNFRMLDSWPLALTGYNHGPSGVLKLTKLHKSRELGDLAFGKTSKKHLGFASRNFFTSFLAVLEVERNAGKYFGSAQWSMPLDAKEIKLPRAIKYSTLVNWFEGDKVRAQIFNPHITSQARKDRVKIPKGSIVSIPVKKEGEVLSSLASAPEIEKKPKKNQKKEASSTR